MIDATFVQAIRSLTEEAVAVETIEIDERTYTNREAFLVKPPRLELPETLIVHTLTGLMDYLKENKDGLALKDYTLHVVNPGTVELISAAQGDYHQRYTFAVAQNYDRFAAFTAFRFGQYIDLEGMNVALQALFEDVGDRGAVLKLMASVKDEASITKEEDGTTQRVTARAGIAFAQEVKAPNPVQLAPYRTFPEVAQPISPFIFRLKSIGGDVHAALFEADGGAWRNAATESIARYFRVTLGEVELAVSGLSVIA